MRLKLADAFLYLVVISIILFLVTITVTFVLSTTNSVIVPEDAITNFEDDLKDNKNTVKRHNQNALRVAEDGVKNVKNFVDVAVDESMTPNSPTATVNPPHCYNIINKRIEKAHQTVDRVSPPWIDLINSDVTNNNSSARDAAAAAAVIRYTTDHHGSKSKLYVQVFAAHTRRLGNQLFNYASLFGIAWRNKRTPLWPDRKTQLRSAFDLRIPIDPKNAVIETPESHFVKLREPGWAIYGPKTERLPLNNVSLTVFLQSWKYFIPVEDQLRIDFTFKPHIVDKARRFLDSNTPPQWRGLDFVRVAIHVRRGDHISKGMQKFGWSLAEPDYFNRSMEYFGRCLPRVQFVVLSNDIKWCRRNIVGPNVVYSTGRSPTDDMCLASLCDHAIVSIGSFSWWVAWFANGVTVTQKNFPKPNSPLLKKLSRTDYYKQEWVAL